MSTTHNRIDKDTVEQVTSFEPILNKFVQSEMQKAIDETQKKLNNMPAVKPYSTGSTPEEKKAIDEWNIKNSNKFEKENMKTSIDEQTMFLNMLKAVT